MFCPKCRGHFLHEYECGVSSWGGGTFDSTILTGAQAKYQAFFNGPSRKNEFGGNTDIMAFAVYVVHQTLLQMPQFSAMFQSQKHMRFLMHLIAHHGFLRDQEPQFKNFYGEDPIVYVREYHLMNKYFQHSCYPNVMEIVCNGQLVMVTARPIKKGDQLFQSRISIDIDSMQERQKNLQNATGKKCFCGRCKGVTMNATKCRELLMEPAYRNLASTLLDPSDSTEKVEKAIENSVMLLRKYGLYGWCNEIQIILRSYQCLLYHHIAGCYT